MRCHILAFALAAVSALPFFIHAQNNAGSMSPTALSASMAELQQAFVGSWAGTLEYRDFSEPATSTKRVKLPTWLTVEQQGADLRFLYIYDDGPAKVVKENSLVRIDPTTATYTVADLAGKHNDSYAIAGLLQLRQGCGTLTLTGSGAENNVQVEVRTTIRMGRNILEITRETAALNQPFSYRHAYTLVRAAPPTNTPGN